MIVDNSTTNHMVSDGSLLNTNLIVFNLGKVQLLNGDSSVTTQSENY